MAAFGCSLRTVALIESFEHVEVRRLLKTLLKEVITEVLKENEASFKTPVSTPASKPAPKAESAPKAVPNPAPAGAPKTTLKKHDLNGVSGGALDERVVDILLDFGMDPDFVRFFDSRPVYAKILNSPNSGDLKDAPRLANSFMRKATFPTIVNDFVKKYPADPNWVRPTRPDPSEILDEIFKDSKIVVDLEDL